MVTGSHQPILKRVGFAFLGLSLLIVAVAFFDAASGVSYKLGWSELFTVGAGTLLVSGSLRAASIVRWISVLLLFALIGCLIVLPIYKPLGLLLTEHRVYPTLAFYWDAVFLLWVGFLYWVIRKLGSEAVLRAQSVAGHQRLDTRIPASISVALVLIPACTTALSQIGTTVEHAKSLAEHELGPRYRFYTRDVRSSITDDGYSYSATVTAWSDSDIRQIPVHWEEPKTR